MTCRNLHDAIVDYARGIELGAGTVAAVESHLEHCGECFARFDRQRRLTESLRALASATADRRAPEDLGRRLARRFEEMHAATHRLPRWLAYAASLALAAAAGGLGLMVQQRAPERDAIPVEAPVAQAAPRGKEPTAPAAAALPEKDRPHAASAGGRAGGRRLAVPPRPAGTSLDGFMALPSAIGLPAFESGRIVRVGLPVTALPAYGVDLVPDPVRAEVEADLLVGQDGQPRAIRLVNSSTDSRSER